MLLIFCFDMYFWLLKLCCVVDILLLQIFLYRFLYRLLIFLSIILFVVNIFVVDNLAVC